MKTCLGVPLILFYNDCMYANLMIISPTMFMGSNIWIATSTSNIRYLVRGMCSIDGG